MKWYEKILKRILRGVFLFLLPVMILFIVLGKAISIVEKMIQPIKHYLTEDRVLGIGMITLISLFVILLVCYLAGMLVESRVVKTFIAKLENNVLIFIPGYLMLKRHTGDVIGETEDKWQAVLMRDNDDWKLGISVDHQPDGFCVIFFPEPPDAKQGEIKLVHESKLKMLNMPVGKLKKIIRMYGQGAAALVNDGK